MSLSRGPRMSKIILICAALLLLVPVSAGCSGDEEEDAAPSFTTASTASNEAPTEENGDSSGPAGYTKVRTDTDEKGMTVTTYRGSGGVEEAKEDFINWAKDQGWSFEGKNQGPILVAKKGDDEIVIQVQGVEGAVSIIVTTK